MREIIEVVLQFIFEYFVYTAADAIYGAKARPAKMFWIRLARFLLLALLGYLAGGLFFALSGPSIETTLGLYPNFLVVAAILAAVLLSAIVALGESRLGNTAVVWVISGVWSIFVISGIVLIAA